MKTTETEKEAKRTGSTFQAWVTPDDVGFLMGAVKMKYECGCTIIGNGTLPHPLEIVYCDTHKQAEKFLLCRNSLRGALSECLTDKGSVAYRNSEYAFRRLDAINDLVNSAKGTP